MNDEERTAALMGYAREAAGKRESLREMLDGCDYAPEERAALEKEINLLEILREGMADTVAVKLDRVVRDVVTARCCVCKQEKECVLFTDWRGGKPVFVDRTACFEHFAFLVKRTKELGLFERRMTPRMLLE